MRRETATNRSGALSNGARWTERDAQAALAACAKSGESTAAFARRHAIPPSRLYWWRNRLRDSGALKEGHGGAPAERSSRLALVPVTVDLRPEPSAVAVEHQVRVEVATAVVRVEVVDTGAVEAAWVARLLRLLKDGGA